ncbi:hypothetical protein DUNSADRAFT_14080 [Dunaliella salina]|uniref:Encoded protein n=1 Tax=Dunaliella salina TaxID=3046 RepID=A0ABQ7G830_DUNSA|nr:hypothetical protein DUNSADRAFT_14080 [Dunaliella salina]|eukprot:KAF5830760.1 hypothetical protein DUNSADRAFT_14080 [Dunaliella salina]
MVLWHVLTEKQGEGVLMSLKDKCRPLVVIYRGEGSPRCVGSGREISLGCIQIRQRLFCCFHHFVLLAVPALGEDSSRYLPVVCLCCINRGAWVCRLQNSHSLLMLTVMHQALSSSTKLTVSRFAWMPLPF